MCLCITPNRILDPLQYISLQPIITIMTLNLRRSGRQGFENRVMRRASVK